MRKGDAGSSFILNFQPCLLVSCVGLLITRLFGLPEFSPYLDVPFVKIYGLC